MKAVVVEKPGPPEVLQIKEIKTPAVKPGWVLIKIKAFGLNRSEMFTRQGHSPSVKFPRVLGIECVGVVERDPSGEYIEGQKVAAIMGGMGRAYDGSYAEYTLVPKEIIFPFESHLPWEQLGAIPEMFQTVSGSLYQALEVKSGEVLLIRGGTSSIGTASCQLAKYLGLTVISTTRNLSKRNFLQGIGADHVLLDTGSIQRDLKELYPNGVEKILELIGTITLKDSLQCVKPKGTVCMTGILGNEWTLKEFTPMEDIPSLSKLTVYMGDSDNLSKESLQEFIRTVEGGYVQLVIDRFFHIAEIAEAHKYMESNEAKGKLVVLV